MNKRLSLITTLISKDDYVADVGCDHGYLGIEALKKGCPFVQFIDNKEGPLNNAKKNVVGFNQENYLFTLSSGITDLKDNIDTVVIAGMGGDLIIQILEQNLNRACKLKKLILEPNRNEEHVRKFLMDHNFEIINELITCENNKYYEIIVCQKVDKIVHYSDLELKFGPILLKEKPVIFIKKYQHLLNKYLSFNSKELNNEIELIKKVINK